MGVISLRKTMWLVFISVGPRSDAHRDPGFFDGCHTYVGHVNQERHFRAGRFRRVWRFTGCFLSAAGIAAHRFLRLDRSDLRRNSCGRSSVSLSKKPLGS